MSTAADVVRNFCALMEQRDAEALRPLLAEGAIYQNVGMPAVTGPDAIVENMATQFAMFPDAYAFESSTSPARVPWCSPNARTTSRLRTEASRPSGHGGLRRR